jgi:DmsE family decaheme c-type cytochrome
MLPHHGKLPQLSSAVLMMAFGLLVLGMASCQSSRQPTVRTEPNMDPGWPSPNPFYTQTCYQAVKAEVPKIEGAEYVKDDEICANCHGAYAKSFAENVHRGDGCESCHGPASRHVETRGKEPGLIYSFKQGNPAVLAETCARCHEQNTCAEGARWRTSKHANRGVTCVSCHRAHYNVPPGTPAVNEPDGSTLLPVRSSLVLAEYQAAADAEAKKTRQPSLKGTSNHLGAQSPGNCYRCHSQMAELQTIPGPHQICGANGFNCTTCHDPHGSIKESSRKDLCLTCHKGAPTMAWYSSSHGHNGVACTDCHNPHPRECVPKTVDIDHYQVKRPQRLPMSVQEPEACYKCHPQIYGRGAMPSHHPIKEGKMVCSDCHDPHGQAQGNLKEQTVNLLCYKCHAEKQGPFAYEHPPVTESCTICHEAHGTVTNNLLRQPTTFLCLRCHSGHYNGDRDLQGHPAFKKEFFTNCTACHPQVHGSDRPSSSGMGGRFTR